MPRKAKSQAQAHLLGMIAGGEHTKEKTGLSAAKAGEMLKGSDVKHLPKKKDEDKIKGGLADDMDPSDFNQEELFAGIAVEFEHTDDIMTAMEIAMDHLEEIPDYYTRLDDMEDKAAEEEGKEDEDPLSVSKAFKVIHKEDELDDDEEEDDIVEKKEDDDNDGHYKHSLTFGQESMKVGR